LALTLGGGGSGSRPHVAAVVVGVDSQVEGEVLSPDGRMLATSDDNGRIRLWDIATRRIIATLTDPNRGEGIAGVAFSQDGRILAAADDGNGRIYLWNIATRTITATLTDPGNHGISDVEFSPDDRVLAADDNTKTYLWNLATRKITETLNGPVGGIGLADIAFSPDGQLLATVCTNGSTDLWDVATGGRNYTLTDPDAFGSHFVDASFSPRGYPFLATVDSDGYVYIWNFIDGRLAATLEDDNILSNSTVAFSPGGGSIATADGLGNIYLWDVSLRAVTATLTPPGRGFVIFNRIMFTPSGNLLAVGANGRIYLWRLNKRRESLA
jgi:WD40 repeat protein